MVFTLSGNSCIYSFAAVSAFACLRCRPESELFRIEFSDLHVSKEDSVRPWCDQLESQLFKAGYFADEHSVLLPADVAAIVDSPQRETLRVHEPWQLARQSDRT